MLNFAGIAASALPGIGSGIAQLFGNKRRKKEEELAMTKIRELAGMFEGNIDDYNEALQKSYYENSDVQDAIRQLTDMGLLQNENIDNQSTAMGSTVEAQIAAKGANKNATAKGLSGIFGNATNYRNMLFSQRGQSQRGLAGATSSLYSAGQKNRQNFNNSLQNIFGNLSQNVGSMVQSGAFDKKKGTKNPII